MDNQINNEESISFCLSRAGKWCNYACRQAANQTSIRFSRAPIWSIWVTPTVLLLYRLIVQVWLPQWWQWICLDWQCTMPWQVGLVSIQVNQPAIWIYEVQQWSWLSFPLRSKGWISSTNLDFYHIEFLLEHHHYTCL